MTVNMVRACAQAGAIVFAMFVCADSSFGQGTRGAVQVAKDVYTMTGAGSNASNREST